MAYKDLGDGLRLLYTELPPEKTPLLAEDLSEEALRAAAAKHQKKKQQDSSDPNKTPAGSNLSSMTRPLKK